MMIINKHAKVMIVKKVVKKVVKSCRKEIV